MLRKKLRISDAIVQIKSDQVLVFLPIITKDETEIVVKRIEDSFAEIGIGSAKMEYVTEHISCDANEE